MNDADKMAARIAVLRDALERRGCDPECESFMNTSESMSGCGCPVAVCTRAQRSPWPHRVAPGCPTRG